jgi:hypothetical protein
MTVYRTIKKLRDCEACQGTGMDKGNNAKCPVCGGDGRVDVYSRVSGGSAVRAEAAAKSLPPRVRDIVRERLQDQEPALQNKKAKPTKDYVEED